MCIAYRELLEKIIPAREYYFGKEINRWQAIFLAFKRSKKLLKNHYFKQSTDSINEDLPLEEPVETYIINYEHDKAKSERLTILDDMIKYFGDNADAIMQMSSRDIDLHWIDAA